MLNPKLFRLLERRFGPGNVKVQAEDQDMVSRYKLDPTQSLLEARQSLHIDHSGEEYMVKCPFCRDWKHRLYINHRWGTYDSVSGSRNLWLAHCWNNECLTKYDNQVSLYDQVMVYTNIGPMDYQAPVVRSDGNLAIRKPRKYVVPGALWQLADMKRRSPHHSTIKYVEDRLWDPVYLSKQYGVSHCVDSFLHEVRGRIVAPVQLKGKDIGWQARYVGEAPKGTMKWYTCPGFSCGRALYNYDKMAGCQTKVIVEGPADVWNFGPQAAGLFNKNMTSDQRKLLAECFRPDDVVVILLDPTQDDKAKARRDQHHIEKLYDTLIAEPKFCKRVIRVYLPHGCDPDELDREYMRELIKHEGRRHNLPITFTKPN